MPTKRASYDLHLHSEWSWDGQASIATYLDHAEQLGLRCIAIADHDTWNCQEEIPSLAAAHPNILCLPGAELFVMAKSLENRWLHLLCYGFGGTGGKEMKQLHTRYGEWLSAGGRALVNALQEVLQLPEEKCVALAEGCSPANVRNVQGITHANDPIVARSLQAHGLETDPQIVKKIVNRMWEGIPPIPTSAEIVPLLKSAGLRTVLAHPYNLGPPDTLGWLDTLREEFQLDGIECAHPKINPELRGILRKYCLANDLFSTGGSDNHFTDGIANSLGHHGGEETWLDEFLERLNIHKEST